MKVLVINASANKERSTTPMLPADTFVKTVNGIFEGMLKKTVKYGRNE